MLFIITQTNTVVDQHILKNATNNTFNTLSPQMPKRTGPGPAGGHGRPVCQGERPGQDPVIILHLRGAEHPALAPPLRLTAVKSDVVTERCWLKSNS